MEQYLSTTLVFAMNAAWGVRDESLRFFQKPLLITSCWIFTVKTPVRESERQVVDVYKRQLVAPCDLVLDALDVVDLIHVLLLGDLVQLCLQHFHGVVTVLELAALGLDVYKRQRQGSVPWHQPEKQRQDVS